MFTLPLSLLILKVCDLTQQHEMFNFKLVFDFSKHHPDYLCPAKATMVIFFSWIFFLCFLPLPCLPKLYPDKGFSWLLIKITTSSHHSSVALITSKYEMGRLGSHRSSIASAAERIQALLHPRGVSCGSSSPATRSWKASASASSTPLLQVTSHHRTPSDREREGWVLHTSNVLREMCGKTGTDHSKI